MNERRLHPFTVLRFLRKTLAVYLLPLVQVLFERNWTALHTALRQDALLFLLLCAVSWGILHVSSWSLDDTGVFHLHWRLGIRLDRALRGEMLAALTIDRPLLYRMAGASRLTLYPVGAAQKHTLSVCLPKADAEAVADQLMPLVKPALHRPAGGAGGAGFSGGQRPLHAGPVRAGRAPDPGCSGLEPCRFCPDPGELSGPIRGAVAPCRRGVAAGGRRLSAGGQPDAQLCPDRALHCLAHGRPDRQPGRLAGTLRVPGADK